MRRPKNAPWHIPDWAWALRAWHKGGRKGPRPTMAPWRVPAWYWAWNTWRNWADRHPKSPDAHPVPPPTPVDSGLVKVRALLEQCRQFSGPYVFGGGHGPYLRDLSARQGLDCSSSTSLALSRVGLMPSSVAEVSTWFERYGEPGRGRYITVHANWEHVWVEFTLPEGWFRFDTSPHGDGPFGPRVRTHRRYDGSFIHRHPKGL